MENDRTYIGKVLRAIRKARGYSAEEIAEKIKINPQTIYGYERGLYMPKAKNTERLFDILRIDPIIFEQQIASSEIETGVADTDFKVNQDGSTTTVSKNSGTHTRRIDSAELAQQIISESNQKREAEWEAARKAESDAEVATDVAGSWLPVISDAAAAECNPGLMPLLECVNQYSEEKAFFPSGKPTDFVIRVSGDSMLPWYPSGTLLLVRPYQDIPNGKRVVAVLDEGEIIFKIFARTRKNEIALMSINEHDGRDYLFPASGKGIRYICRVVQSIRNEDDLDHAMSVTGLHHNWEKKLDKLNGK